MNNKVIRVMLCDDSATMRRLIKQSLKSATDISVVAEAKHGQDAIDQLAAARPDVVVLDVEMPVMDGIDTTKNIRSMNADLPIIMFSSLTSRGAEATFDAMQAGANDFATKPSSLGHIGAALERVRNDLLPKIRVMVGRAQQKALPVPEVASHCKLPDQSKLGEKEVVAVGVSTGGPDALVKLLSNIPKQPEVPILITQHMPPVFTKLLAQRLTQQTGHCVEEATDDCKLRPGHIFVAPGDYHMIVKRCGLGLVTRLTQDAPEHACRPSVDPLFRSVAACCGERALGIVLTGMGKDGCEGAKSLKAAGSSIFVQDEASSVIWGMPGQVVKAGCADEVLTLEDMGLAISTLQNTKSTVAVGS